jgi:nitroreductase
VDEMTDKLGFFDLVEARRSVRIFDQKSVFDHAIVEKCLKTATMAPNSSNLKLWEFYRIPESSQLKHDLAKFCMN